MSAVSTQLLAPGTLGTWATSSMVQASSSVALGMYQISLPNGMLASGDHATALLYGAPGTAPVPITIDLTTYAVNVKQINGVAIVGNGAGTPFNV